MKLWKVARLAALVLLLLPCGALANTIDPTVIVNDPSGSNGIVLFSNVLPMLTFPSDPLCSQTGSMTCTFINASGGPFTNLLFNINPSQLPLFVSSNVFGSFTVSNNGQFLLFLGGAIPNDGREFTIEFRDFSPGTTFQVVANVPEPGTMALFLTGLGALFARRRLGKG
jgi:hypothetical protein